MAKRTMPAQKPGTSKQDYGTPRSFLDETRRMLGIVDFAIDLAATSKNRVTDRYISRSENSLTQNWADRIGRASSDDAQRRRWGWLNHPFGDSAAWIEYACQQAAQGARFAQLTPAAVGTNYWHDFVHEHAHVLLLRPRIQFVGADDPYIKDLVLLLWNGDCAAKGGMAPPVKLYGRDDDRAYLCFDWMKGRIS